MWGVDSPNDLWGEPPQAIMYHYVKQLPPINEN